MNQHTPRNDPAHSAPGEPPAAARLQRDSEICFMPAARMASLIRQSKLSARDVMAAHLNQIDRVNPRLNAIITLLPHDQLLAQAQAADEAIVHGRHLGPLHGIPIGVKDNYETSGIRTTFGSVLFRDYVPEFDCLVVEREKHAGAIIVGKTNLPEFGLGSQTFNKVFGATPNPYDLTKTCGGSSGGGAVALACGMLPLADGGDMGGSLRNPPDFCNVVGLRTSPGRVPNSPSLLGWQTQGVAGPMARNVADCGGPGAEGTGRLADRWKWASGDGQGGRRMQRFLRHELENDSEDHFGSAAPQGRHLREPE